MTPRLIIEVRWGSMNGRKLIVDPGTRVRVGRTDFADLVVPHDEHMSGVHFELTWDGKVCTLHDLNSARGTLLGGQRVTEGEVPHGGWIQAGETDFLLYIEQKTPPRIDEPDDEDELAREAWLAEKVDRDMAAESALIEVLDDSEPLFAVLDTARDERILELLRQSPEEHRSLYDGIQGETLSEVAPYLVGPMISDSNLLPALIREGWGKRWGIYLKCPLPFVELRRHLRRFLMVEEEATGERLYFRYYDPNVLRIFMPTCTRRQAEQFMGEIEEIIAESPDREVLRFGGFKARGEEA